METHLSKFPNGWFEGTSSLTISSGKSLESYEEMYDYYQEMKGRPLPPVISEKPIPLVNPRSDFTFIGEDLWAFRASDYGATAEGYGAIYIYNPDYSLNRQLLHNFGHVNTIDYKKELGALIFGTG